MRRNSRHHHRHRRRSSTRNSSSLSDLHTSRTTGKRPEVRKGRVVTVFVILIAVMAGLMFRLVNIHASPDERILTEVFIPLGVVTVPGPRGTIVDRNGRTIALSLPSATVIADPRLITNPETTAATLAQHLDMPAYEILPKLQRASAFSYVTRQVDEQVGEQIKSLGLNGIDVIAEPRREHPNGNCSGLAAVGRVNVDHVGMSGIEDSHNEQLSGTAGRIVKEVGIDGTTIPGGIQQITEAQPGSDLVVTLDRNIQYQAERLLIEAVADAQASRGVALVSLPNTGDILAMANVIRGSDSIVNCTRENLAATWVYEPGSVFKPITMAAALSSGSVIEDALIRVPPELTISDHVFVDEPHHDHVDWSPSRILTYSSNVGTIKIAQVTGKQALYSMIRQLGFGTRTDVDFQGESKGLVLPVNKWNSLTLPNVAIGQGVAVTPLQLLQAYNVIANSGVLVPLHILSDSGPSDSGTSDTSNGSNLPAPYQALDPRTSQSLMRMLGTVVIEGTAQRAHVPGFVMSGKTGTAWQPCDEGYECINERGELIGRHHSATFAGIVSNDDGPAMTVLVVIDNPKGNRISGGQLAAPIASQIAEYSLRQLKIPVMSDIESGQRLRAQHVPEPQPVPPDAGDTTSLIAATSDT